jgi:UDP-N-acetylmuramoylalanine--D-glutamate ligase
LPKRDVYDEAIAAGIPVNLGWSGWFSEEAWDLVVTNPAVPKGHEKLCEAVQSGRQVISEVEFAYRISRAPIVAITGTNGKSTTTVMTMLCLRAGGIDAVLCGNIFGSGYPEIPLTEAALRSTPEQVLVAEISSFQLEWVVEFDPIVAGITNITPDHLDRHPTFADYAETKHRIFAAQSSRDFAVVRANDPVVHVPGAKRTAYRPRHSRRTEIAAEEPASAPTVLTFGATGEHARVEENELAVLHRHIKIDSLPFREPHNLTNAAMACLLAYAVLAVRANQDPESDAAELLYEAEKEYRRTNRRSVYDSRVPEEHPFRVLPDKIIEGLMQFRGLAHRMEWLGERGGVRVVNNSMCTNPDAVIKSAQSIRDRTHLLIGGVNKGLDFKPLAHYLANHRNKAYLFGTDGNTLDNMLGGGYPVFATLNLAFEAATREARPGEVIMLAPGCASTDQFRDFRERGEVFKAMAKEWLES